MRPAVVTRINDCKRPAVEKGIVLEVCLQQWCFMAGGVFAIVEERFHVFHGEQ